MTLRAAHITSLAEAITVRQRTEFIAVCFDSYRTRYNDIETVIDFAFTDDVFAIFVFLPSRV